MAFPSGYATYQEVTIDHTKVASDQTDFVVYINLADLVKAGADIFDSCRSDGGDIRATKTDGTTELPVEVVAIDTTGKTGEVHIKFTGTLSSSTDTVIRLWYNGTDTIPAVTDTYGRNAVWSDYTVVWHGVDATTSTALDSTGNGLDGNKRAADAPISQTSGLWGNEFNYAGTDYICEQNAVFDTTSQQFTAQTWFKLSALPTGTDSFGLFVINSGLNDGTRDKQIQVTYQGRILFQTYDGSVDISQTGTSYVSAGTYYMAHGVFNGSNVQLFANGSAQTAASTTTTFNHTNAGLQVSDQIGNTKYVTGVSKEIRRRPSALSANWITTEYNNQNSPSTFYSTGNEVGSGTDYPMTASVGTFTLNGIATSVTSQRTVVGGISSFTLTGIDVAFAIGKGINCSTGEFVLTGNSTGLSSQRTMPVSVGSFVLTGIDANFEFTQRIVAETGVFIFTGMDAVLRPSNIWSNTEKNNVDWVNSSKS